MDTAKTRTRPWWNGPDIKFGKEFPAGEVLLGRNRKSRQRLTRCQQMLDRIDAENRGKQRRRRWQAADVMSDALRHALVLQATGQALRKTLGQSGDHEGEERPDRQCRARVLEGRAHPRSDATVLAPARCS